MQQMTIHGMMEATTAEYRKVARHKGEWFTFGWIPMIDIDILWPCGAHWERLPNRLDPRYPRLTEFGDLERVSGFSHQENDLNRQSTGTTYVRHEKESRGFRWNKPLEQLSNDTAKWCEIRVFFFKSSCLIVGPTCPMLKSACSWNSMFS
jgi:hypothetical protein